VRVGQEPVKIRLLSVGKPKDSLLARVHDLYAERIPPLGAIYETAWVPDVRPGGRYTGDHARQREGRALLERIGAGGSVVALERSGRQIGSEELAERLERWASPSLTLVVGGPSGLDRAVLERADRSWSLSRLTFPHELVRGLVAEQVYRALTILRGLPYHK